MEEKQDIKQEENKTKDTKQEENKTKEVQKEYETNQKIMDKLKNKDNFTFGEALQVLSQKKELNLEDLFKMQLMTNLAGANGNDKKSSNVIDFKELLTMMMMIKMMGDGGSSKYENIITQLSNKIDNMKSEQATSEIIKLIPTFIGVQQAKTNDMADILTKIEGIKADKDKAIAEARAELDKLKSDKVADELKDIKDQMRAIIGGDELTNKLKEKVASSLVSKLDVALGIEKPKSKFDEVKDVISTFTDKIKEPILGPLGQAFADRIANPPVAPAHQQPALPQLPQDQMTQNLMPEEQEEKQDEINYSAPKYKDLIRVGTGKREN